MKGSHPNLSIPPNRKQLRPKQNKELLSTMTSPNRAGRLLQSFLLTAGRLPEKTKITIVIKHLSAHVVIFSIAMALENVQNHFFELKTGKVVLR
jgi:hypothetical protein